VISAAPLGRGKGSMLLGLGKSQEDLRREAQAAVINELSATELLAAARGKVQALWVEATSPGATGNVDCRWLNQAEKLINEAIGALRQARGEKTDAVQD